jgi:hypothetical protein
MRRPFLLPLVPGFALLVALAACVWSPDDPSPGLTVEPDVVDTLRYDIDPTFAGRALLVDWYHVSFGSPLAARTLATRPMVQALSLADAAGRRSLPATVDSIFEFYAKFAQYAADEAAGSLKQNFADSAAWYQSHRRWAIAPLLVARTDEMASMTLAQYAAGETPKDTVALFADHVLLWVRDSIVAEQDGLLAKRKLTGNFGPGWHLLRYRDSNRSLESRPFSDTVKFRADFPKPNLM